MNELSSVKKNFIDHINNLIVRGKISHAYLIEVSNYNEDFELILSFIKMILCNIKYEELLDADDKIIKLIDNNDYPDVSIVSTEGNIIKKDSMIDLQKEFSNKSLYGSKKIYVIKEAEKLNDHAANTILKFLEEPEDNIIAFLIADSRYHVIETIVSRCQVLSLKDDIDITNDYSFLSDYISYIMNPNDFFINYNTIISKDGFDKTMFKSYLEQIERVFLKVLSTRSTRDNIDDLVGLSESLFDKISNGQLINYISIIEDEIVKLDYNINFKLWLCSFFARLIGG